MTPTIFTFGYEGLSIETFIRRLDVERISNVIDVRAMPLSRKRGFSKTSFREALRRAGIEYAHMPLLGCPKVVRDRYKSDGDWTAYTRSFEAYLTCQTSAVTELAAAVAGAKSCLVCFEADFSMCHRTFVARAAARHLKGATVAHLTSQTVIPDLVVHAAA